jgi:hypothetical protein
MKTHKKWSKLKITRTKIRNKKTWGEKRNWEVSRMKTTYGVKTSKKRKLEI